MADKVIFEYRAECAEDGCGFRVWHDAQAFAHCGPPIAAFCLDDVPGAHRPRRSKRNRQPGHKARHHMRETLDFFERMYDDLFGDEEPGVS